MKKYVMGIIFIFVLSLATGCGTKEIICEDFDGNFLEAQNECEYVTQEECDILGGTFEDCASACRHDPNAEICTMQCVPVCYLQ
jgi:hypothetical protein